jgi:DNA-binding NarL/FixJ family response regulator
MRDLRPIWDRCTEAQRKVLVVLANHGWENQRIARELGSTQVGVKSLIRTMCAKFKLRGRTALVMAYLAECQEQETGDPFTTHEALAGRAP